MEQKNQHLEPTRPVSRTLRFKRYFSFGAVGLLLIAVPVCIALGTPTPDEVMERELVSLGADWAKWDNIESAAQKALTEAKNAKLDIHERAEVIRSVFQ